MVSGTAAAAILTLLGVLHVYWACGGTWGKSVTVPTIDGKPVIHPTPLTTVIVAAGLFAMAALVALKIALWLIAAIFLLRALGDFRYVGFFKRVRNSPLSKWIQSYTRLCVSFWPRWSLSRRPTVSDDHRAAPCVSLGLPRCMHKPQADAWG